MRKIKSSFPFCKCPFEDESKTNGTLKNSFCILFSQLISFPFSVLTAKKYTNVFTVCENPTVHF